MRDILRSVHQSASQTALETIIVHALALQDAKAKGALLSFDEAEVDEAVNQIKYWAERLPELLKKDLERAREGKQPAPMVSKLDQPDE